MGSQVGPHTARSLAEFAKMLRRRADELDATVVKLGDTKLPMQIQHGKFMSEVLPEKLKAFTADADFKALGLLTELARRKR